MESFVITWMLFLKVVRLFFRLLSKTNWIKKTQPSRGIEIFLHRMSSRTTLPEKTDFASRCFGRDMTMLKAEFASFFPALIHYGPPIHLELPLNRKNIPSGIENRLVLRLSRYISSLPNRV